ncbi:hypothetical protein GJAV_G00181660 [Gymnothorax javanicus]|nr:hypothetical protein GJAV_G00181660 [Gymnothorax javanicus]
MPCVRSTDIELHNRAAVLKAEDREPARLPSEDLPSTPSSSRASSRDGERPWGRQEQFPSCCGHLFWT